MSEWKHFLHCLFLAGAYLRQSAYIRWLERKDIRFSLPECARPEILQFPFEQYKTARSLRFSRRSYDGEQVYWNGAVSERNAFCISHSIMLGLFLAAGTNASGAPSASCRLE